MQFALALLALAVVGQAVYVPAHGPWGAPLPLAPVYAKSYIPTTVKVGESHYSYPVPEHRFTRTDYETPGKRRVITSIRRSWPPGRVPIASASSTSHEHRPFWDG